MSPLTEFVGGPPVDERATCGTPSEYNVSGKTSKRAEGNGTEEAQVTYKNDTIRPALLCFLCSYSRTYFNGE